MRISYAACVRGSPLHAGTRVEQRSADGYGGEALPGIRTAMKVSKVSEING
jgi:hypothetical protein